MENWYKYLEIENFSDIEEVKRAYRDLSRKYHPDNFIGFSESEKQKSEKVQQKLNEIWQALSDEKKKHAYDEKLKYELDRQKYSSYSKATNQSQKSVFTSQNNKKGFFSSQNCQKGFSHSDELNQEDDKSNLRNLLAQKNKLKNEYTIKKSKIIKEKTASEEYKNLKTKCNQLDYEIYSLQLKKDSLTIQINNSMNQEVVKKESLFHKLFKSHKQLNQPTIKEEEPQEKLSDLLDEITCKRQEKQAIEEKMERFISEDILNQNVELSNILAKIDEIDIQIEMLKSKFDKDPIFTTSEVKNDRNKK